jgi:hypothetical protein
MAPARSSPISLPLCPLRPSLSSSRIHQRLWLCGSRGHVSEKLPGLSSSSVSHSPAHRIALARLRRLFCVGPSGLLVPQRPGRFDGARLALVPSTSAGGDRGCGTARAVLHAGFAFTPVCRNGKRPAGGVARPAQSRPVRGRYFKVEVRTRAAALSQSDGSNRVANSFRRNWAAVPGCRIVDIEGPAFSAQAKPVESVARVAAFCQAWLCALTAAGQHRVAI